MMIKRSFVILLGVLTITSLLMSGCRRDSTSIEDAPISIPDPWPKPILAPSSNSGTPSDQKSIIAALKPISAKRIGYSEVGSDRVRTFLNGSLIIPSVLTKEGGGQFLVPIRGFYKEIDRRNDSKTVVYWVSGKQRVLVSKKPIPSWIIIIGGVGYAWPSSIGKMQNWDVTTSRSNNGGEIEFISSPNN